MAHRAMLLSLLMLPVALMTGATENAAKVRDGYTPIDSFKPHDLSWVQRSLKKSPDFKSEKVRYTVWVLGEAKDAVMVMAWDESGGTGTGYDTLYIDRNFNGDLTEADEKIHKPTPQKSGKRAPMVGFDVNGIKDASGRTYRLVMQMQNGKYHWKSGFFTTIPGLGRSGSYKVGLLPGNLQIKYAHTLAEAPIYRLGGGEALLLPTKTTRNGRKRTTTYLKPGDDYGTLVAGRKAGVNLVVSHYGPDLSSQLRFYHGKAGGQPPRVKLRILKDGQFKEDIPFTGGCG